MFYTTPVLVFPSNTDIAQYKTYYEQNGYVTNIFINLSLGHISNTKEARKAFLDLKNTLSTPPILAVPKEREKLCLYVAARNSVVSTTLVVERTEEGKVQSIQRPIYYLSMLLTKSQQRYRTTRSYY